MSHKLFSVTPSFVQGERHIDRARPFAEGDFSFSARQYESADPKWGIKAGVEVTGVMLPDLHAELTKVFPQDCPARFDRYEREACEALSAGTFKASEGVEDDYRGCRDDKGREAKAKRVLPGMRMDAEALVPGLRRVIVERVNGLVEKLTKDSNESYARSAVQNLVVPWKGLYEEAGVADKVEHIAEARRDIARLDNEVQAELNAWMLADMEKEGWKVNGKPLAAPVVGELKALYSEGKAFGHGPMRHF